MRESGQTRVDFAPNAPFDASVQYLLIYSLWFLDRIEEADRVASRAMEMWPRHYGVWFGRLWLLAGTSRYDRALAQVDDAAARPALPPPIIDTLRAALLRRRHPAAVRAAVDGDDRVSRSVAAVFTGMMLLNHLGATDRAFDLARAYYLEQGPIIAAVSWGPGQPVIQNQRRRKTNMLFTPTAAAMRSDPRFMPLMEQMGLADYWDSAASPVSCSRVVPPDASASMADAQLQPQLPRARRGREVAGVEAGRRPAAHTRRHTVHPSGCARPAPLPNARRHCRGPVLRRACHRTVSDPGAPLTVV
jgi:hypothetical protein